MSIIFQTARLPIVYKANFWSLATIFHTVCTIIKYLLPVLACFFYIDSHTETTFDLEPVTITPGNIIYFNAVNKFGRYIIYPPDKFSDSSLPDKLLFLVQPQYDDKNYLTSWKTIIRIPIEGASIPPDIVSISILFDFTAKLSKYATNTIHALGSFSRTFHEGVSQVVCHGDLTFEQTEIIEFRGTFSETDLPSLNLSDFDSISDIIAARDLVSTLFYVDWNDPNYVFYTNQSDPYSFEIELNVNVKDITIFHSIPLVSSLESFLIIFLSTYLFSSIVLDNLQGFIFRHGIIKSWAIPLYQKPKKGKGMI